jgi:hypothetical protein
MLHCPRLALWLLATAIVGASNGHAQARSAAIVGWIRDSTGRAVDRADVEIEAMHAVGRTDSTGHFALRGLDAGSATVRIRRLGYEPQSFDFVLHAATVDTVAVTMEVNTPVLDAVRTNASIDHRRTALEGFYRRKAAASGIFITRQDIERRNTNVLSETLREVPGVRVVRAGSRSGLRFDSSNTKPFDCPPQYWVDGRRVSGAEIDDFPATDIEAMELYRGPSTTPTQFAEGVRISCGAVVIWTRIPGGP